MMKDDKFIAKVHGNIRRSIMKRIVASLLCITTVISLAACGKKNPDQTGLQPSESFAETSDAEPADPSASAPASQTSIVNPAAEYVKDRVEKLTVVFEADPEEGEEGEEEELEYHIPELTIKSSYAESVNKEVAQAFDKYKKDLEKGDGLLFFGTAYVAYLTKDNVLSLVFISYEDTDLNEYKVYNIDVKTGEKVDNARIAQIAGVSDIRKAAMDALQNWYNNMEIVKIKDYKVVLENGEKLDSQMKSVESTFGEKYLNDKMQIGLTNEGKLFFVSTVDFMAGAELYDWAYDVDGNDIDDEDNPYWVGAVEPDDGVEADVDDDDI